MDVYVARQPIFDCNNITIAYELLFRNSLENKYSGEDGYKATLEVINNTFFTIGLNNVIAGKKAFINLNESLLKTDFITALPPEYVVIEVLETVEPTDEIIERCKELKNKGYTLALDDFVFYPKYRKLLDVVDIIKVDFTITTGSARKLVMELVKNKNIKFLAEKVETKEEYLEAISYGYAYFQGYFFSKPEILIGKDIPLNKMIYLRLIKELNSKEFHVDKLEELIVRDVSIAYKLLKMINSSSFGIRNKITSMKLAINMMGEKEMIKWLYMLVIRGISLDKPGEIITLSLQRAKFCEQIAILSNNKAIAFDAYLTGMLSTMDAILNLPMEKILDELSIGEDVKVALTKGSNTLGVIYMIVKEYEKGNFDRVIILSHELNINAGDLGRTYFNVLSWIKDV
ncbi:EAL and HDOD domain-containing protein [Clostridium sp. CF012]|uniref:EAL and HDOD domain-containing protein n=1 Tax=Clostridium sp. CF012 TaxID=2843319 RepID=UPI001C0E2A30|nr:HDOD domain-containing protein [Clostridium sp. CF012]MBU3145501.1 HDOD domain-containing protein [Clostridium sp. CF012]